MPERKKRLTEKLAELDQHIAGEAALHDELKEPLDSAIVNLRQMVQEDRPEEEHQELSEILSDLALSAEVSHPRLTQLLNHMSELLAGAGI